MWSASSQGRPLPPVSIKEWDGLMRLCFNRKNKTLGSIFTQRTVLSALEKNYETLQALQTSPNSQMDEDNKMGMEDVEVLANMVANLSMETDSGQDDGGDGMDMEDADMMTDGGEASGKVLEVLSQGDFGEKRASKLTQEDFLVPLSQFNKAGIHFS